MVFQRWLTVALLVLGNACVSVDFTSRLSPAYDGAPLGKTVVLGEYEDLAVREFAESKLAWALEQRGCESVKWLDLFFVGDNYDADALAATLDREHVEAVLILGTTDLGSTLHYIPQTQHTTSTAYGTANTRGNTTTARVHGESTTYTTGGHNVSKPWATYEATLIEVNGWRTLWVASGRAKGNAYVNHRDLLTAACKKVVAKMERDGVVVAPPSLEMVEPE